MTVHVLASETSAPPCVSVLGPKSLATQLLARVLVAGGARIVEGHDRIADVAVLVDPTAQHWDLARVSATSVVLLADEPPLADDLVRAIEQGTRAVLPLTCDGTELMRAISAVARGETWLTRAQTAELCHALRQRPRTDEEHGVHLTPREEQILRSIEAGELVKQTARSLGISPRTVENTQRVLFRKLGVRNRAQAIARAYSLGFAAPPERLGE